MYSSSKSYCSVIIVEKRGAMKKNVLVINYNYNSCFVQYLGTQLDMNALLFCEQHFFIAWLLQIMVPHGAHAAVTLHKTVTYW